MSLRSLSYHETLDPVVLSIGRARVDPRLRRAERAIVPDWDQADLLGVWTVDATMACRLHSANEPIDAEGTSVY